MNRSDALTAGVATCAVAWLLGLTAAGAYGLYQLLYLAVSKGWIK